MGSLHYTVVSFFLLIFSVGIIIFLFCIFDGTTFPLPQLQKPLPEIRYGIFPTAIKLLNLPQFQFIINSDTCLSNLTVIAALIITSHAGNIETRSAMRRAYPAEELKEMGIHRVFLLALYNSKDDHYNSVSQNALQDENNRYFDLVQGNFNEDYHNLTYKHMMGLHWATSYCSQAKYIIKMDDDIVVDFYRLLKTIKSIKPNKSLLMGYLLKGTRPIRLRASKWFVTWSEYPQSIYPPFLSGWLYITTPRDARKLIEASKSIPYFWIDDTYVTGLLAQAAGISHQDIRQHFAVHSEYLDCCIRDSNYFCDYMIGPKVEILHYYYVFRNTPLAVKNITVCRDHH